MFKITLADGRTIDNLVLNGNNYISEYEIDDSFFSNIMNEVTIESEDVRIVYEKMKLISHIKNDGKSWLVFAEPTLEELQKMQIDSRFKTVELEQEVIITVLADIMGV